MNVIALAALTAAMGWMPTSWTIASAAVRDAESSAWSKMKVFPPTSNSDTVCAAVVSALAIPIAMLATAPELTNVCTLSVANVRVSLFGAPCRFMIIAHCEAVLRLARPAPLAAVCT